MAARGLRVKSTDEILRLKALGFSKRKIARTLGVHRNTVAKYFEPTAAPADLLPPTVAVSVPTWCESLDWQLIRDEIQKNVPIQIVYGELFDQGKVPVTYTAFWKQLRRRAPNLKTTMVRTFQPGSRIEIDYADGIGLVNMQTGELMKTQLFVGVLCSSRYAFAEFTMSQKSEDFLSSHVRMLEYFGGSAQVVSPDNLKSAVLKANAYDPVLNPAYTRLASHYGFAVVPARVRRPQDKAIVERSIQIFQRWFFMLVRNRTFTSLIELNQCLREHLVKFNEKRHRIFNRTRSEMFEVERSHLMPLPKDVYSVQTYAQAKLSRDCHLVFDHNFYSAPHALRGLELEIWATATAVEIYHALERVAVHARYGSRGKFATDKKHYPPGHQAYLEEDITQVKAWAQAIGPETLLLISELLSGEFPLRYLRRTQSILSLSKKYSRARLESAATAANRFNNKNLNYIQRVIVAAAPNETRERR